MKVKLLKQVRKNFIIVDYPAKKYFIVKYKGNEIDVFGYFSVGSISRDKKQAYQICLDEIINVLRKHHKSLGYYNRGKKVWNVK